MRTAGVLLVGVLAGSLLVSLALYSSGFPEGRTLTETRSSTTTTTETQSGYPIGTFASYAVVFVSAKCSGGGNGGIECGMLITNTGGAEARFSNACTLTYNDSALGSQTIWGTILGPIYPVNPGSSMPITCFLTEHVGYGGPISGSPFRGSLSFSEVAVPFTGSFR